MVNFDALQTFLLGAVLVAGSVAVLNHAAQATMDEIEWEEDIHHVKQGETLWYIATDYCPKNVDKREWIAEVKTLNHMENNTLRAGDFLTVLKPAQKEATDD
jgi:hypothetical protein